MLKNLLIVLLCLCCIIIGSGYYAYTHRDMLMDKLVSYAVNNLTGASNDVSAASWSDAIMKAGMESVKRSVEGAVSKQSSQVHSRKNQDSLATLADMFANATNSNDDHLGQMAQVFLRGMSNISDERTFQQNDAAVRDINARDNKGRTLLMNVCRTDVSPRVVGMLIQDGADVHACDDSGRTALMYAVALNQNAKVVDKLLRAGVDVNAVDDQGKTAWDYAKQSEIKSLLQQYMR